MVNSEERKNNHCSIINEVNFGQSFHFSYHMIAEDYQSDELSSTGSGCKLIKNTLGRFHKYRRLPRSRRDVILCTDINISIMSAFYGGRA